MDHDLLTMSMSDDSCPPWTCGKCRKGVVFLRKDSFRGAATAISQAIVEFTDEPEDMLFLFSCIADCSVINCGESYIISGNYRLKFSTHHHDPNSERWKEFCFKSIFPALALVDCPPRVPESVMQCIDRACLLFWSDKSACLNALRTSIEAVCDNMKVRKTSTAKGKRRNLSLHQRLDQLRKTDPETADILLAAKWIGNAGSHYKTSPSVQDTINAIKLVDYAVNRLYGDRDKAIRSVAKRVNRKKGI